MEFLDAVSDAIEERLQPMKEAVRRVVARSLTTNPNKGNQ
jgi:hypothetical protein